MITGDLSPQPPLAACPMTSRTRRRLAALTFTLLALPPAALSLTTPAHADAQQCIDFLRANDYPNSPARVAAACTAGQEGDFDRCAFTLDEDGVDENIVDAACSIARIRRS
ncbi:hypothetical protein ACIBG7_27015 [Nonomuraea sp. NPDC050328]|uniref:hypothetical protein n=1 Tax=Nonomuraea sp. NPDC050328 TaxID=3364361 RepID=UPI0037AD28D6